MEEYRSKLRKLNRDKYNTNEKHRENSKKHSEEKYRTNAKHKEKKKQASRKKYRKDMKHQKQLKEKITAKYKDDASFRENVKRSNKLKYQDKDYQLRKRMYTKKKYEQKPELKEKILICKKNKKEVKKKKCQETNYVLENFQQKASQGPNYACSSCHRLLFQNQVQPCVLDSYKEKSDGIWRVAKQCISNKYIHECVQSCPQNCTLSSHWLCKTCQRKIVNGQIPEQSAANNLQLFDIPEELQILNSLEKHLIALHIPFMKVASLPRGGQNAIYGPVVCVSSDTKKVEALPRKTEEDGNTSEAET